MSAWICPTCERSVTRSELYEKRIEYRQIVSRRIDTVIKVSVVCTHCMAAEVQLLRPPPPWEVVPLFLVSS